MVEPSRDQAILAGDNSREPGLMFLPLNPRLSVGDRVVTSGRGGVLPPGLAIGVVSAIGEQKVSVTPLVDWDRLAYVRLLEYARVLPPEQLEELQQELYGPPLPPDYERDRSADRRRLPTSPAAGISARRAAHAAVSEPAPIESLRSGAAGGDLGMTWLWLRQLDAELRALVPFATALIAVLVDVAPLVGTGPTGLTSFATLCVVFFWSLYRPDLFTPTAAFLAGLVYDGLAGLPLGLTSLALLLVRNLMVLQQRFFLARSFPVIWCCFALLAPAVEAARWLLSSLWWGQLFAPQPTLLELLVTMRSTPRSAGS